MGMGVGGGVWPCPLDVGVNAGVVVLVSLLVGFFTALPLACELGAMLLPWPLRGLLGEKFSPLVPRVWWSRWNRVFLARFVQERLEGRFLPLEAG